MPAIKCSAEVSEIRVLTYDVKEISLKLIDPPQVQFLAGQYISIEVTEIKDGVSRLNNRPYSIVSPPEEQETIKLCANLVKGGPGSTYLHTLKMGDKLQFLYPMGYFTLNDPAETSLLFVATGTGIAPLKAMILHLLHRGSQRQISLYWGLRHEKDLYYHEEFTALSKQHPSFHFFLTLSQPSPQWLGMRGRVTDHLREKIESVENLTSALCGNGGMIKDVRSLLMEKGMPKKSIHFEKFYN